MVFKKQNVPYDLGTPTGQSNMSVAIDRVPRGNNTTVYYAMELAAERVKYVRKKVAKNDPKTRYYIFLLTDGLDNGSSAVAKSEKRILFDKTPEQYKKRVQKKLKSAMGWFGKNTFEVYPLLYEGEDLQETKEMNGWTESKLQEVLAQEMSCFRYSSKGKAPDVIIGRNYEAIMSKLRKTLEISNYTFRVPKGYSGKKIRMNFENSKGEKVTMTAMLKKSFFSYKLTDIKFSNGVTIRDNKTTLSSLPKDDKINKFFLLEDIRLDSVAYRPVSITQDYEAGGYWNKNSEYEEVQEDAINTYIIFVIDGSNSLDGKNGQMHGFEEETKRAKEILGIMTPSKKQRYQD